MARFTPPFMVSVARLLRIAQEMYPNESSRVDYDGFMKLVVTPMYRRDFEKLVRPWLQMTYQTPGGVLLWTALTSATSKDFVGMLKGFYSYGNAVVATATKLRETATVIRKHGWRQGDAPAGFDIHGALRVVFQDEFSIHRLTVLDMLRANVHLITGDETMTLVDWNDTPGRTAGDVLSLLESSATEIDTID